MSHSGRYVAIRQRGGVDLVDALGTAPRQVIDVPGLLDFTCVGQSLWAATDQSLHRFALDTGKELGTPGDVRLEHGRLLAGLSDKGETAMWLGYRRLLLRDEDGQIEYEDITGEAGPAAYMSLLGGRRLLVVEGRKLSVRDPGRSDLTHVVLPVVGPVVAGTSMFDGRALAVLMEGEDEDSFAVIRPNGSLVHNVPVPKSRFCAIATTRGLALVQQLHDDALLAIDLRYGKLLARTQSPIPLADIDIDSDAKYLVLAGFERPVEDEDRYGGDGQTSTAADRPGGHSDGDGDEDDDYDAPLAALHIPYTDLFGSGTIVPRRRGAPAKKQSTGRAGPLRIVDAREGQDDGSGQRSGHKTLVQRDDKPVDAAAGERTPQATEEVEAEPEQIEIPEGPLLGLGRLVTPPRAKAPPGARPYTSPRAHLDELLDLVAARTARAIAHAWDTGRLSLPSEDARPFEREVQALVGKPASHAPDALSEAEDRLAQLTAIAGRRALASLAAGQSLPFVDVAREFDLSTTEAQVLLVAAAPALRGEIARLYGVLANDENRPICDRYLIELILGGEDRATRDAVARALSSDSTLARHGLVRIAPSANDQYLFAPVSVDPVLLNRLRGDRFGGTGPTDNSSIRWADRPLEELAMPEDLKRDIVVELQRPARDGRPYRIVLCGRRGSGRRSLAAALVMGAEGMNMG
ncbi:MAG: hypothetical protein AAGC55_16285, partial [Myxococcota bacterium]